MSFKQSKTDKQALTNYSILPIQPQSVSEIQVGPIVPQQMDNVRHRPVVLAVLVYVHVQARLLLVCREGLDLLRELHQSLDCCRFVSCTGDVDLTPRGFSEGFYAGVGDASVAAEYRILNFVFWEVRVVFRVHAFLATFPRR